jgi:cytochrome c553
MHKSRLAVLFSIALAGAVATTTVMAQDPAAAGEPKRGAVLANTCIGCHGIDGYRNAYPSFRVPKLGGQHPDYIVIALQGYKNQTRPHNTMHAQAATMSEQEMRDIAAFFASEGAIEPGASPAAAVPEKAATCVACHGEGGVSVAPNWPSLAGQHKDYLVHALNEYKNGLRKDAVMGSQAMGLTPADIEELATYFAKRPGLFTVHYGK